MNDSKESADRFILAVDTSGTQGSLALGQFKNQQIEIVNSIAWSKKAMHSELAVSSLAELLKMSSVDLSRIEKICVNVGPGSFTGIRVGLNLARTISYALDLPIACLNSLEVLANNEWLKTSSHESVIMAIKAIQNFYYVAGFDFAKTNFSNLQPQSMTKETLATFRSHYTKVLIEGESHGFLPETEAQNLLQFLETHPRSARFFSWREAKPLYIRASEAEEKLRQGLLKPV